MARNTDAKTFAFAGYVARKVRVGDFVVSISVASLPDGESPVGIIHEVQFTPRSAKMARKKKKKGC